MHRMSPRNIDSALLRGAHVIFRDLGRIFCRRRAVEGGDGTVVVEDICICIHEIPVEDADEVSLDFVHGSLVKVGGGDPHRIFTQPIRGIL